MENNHPSPLHLLILILILLTMLTTTISPSPSPSPSPLPSQSPSTPTPPPLEQVNNIIDALIGASDFTTWVSILSMSNPTMLPLSATLFIPHDNSFSHNNNHSPMDPFLFPYHVVPQRLTFSDLLLLPPSTRLPTLLPYRTISVTNNSASNFSLDATPITHPDLYSTPSLVVHGVANLLDYSLFGHGIPSPPSPEDHTPSPPPFGWKSGAAGSTSSWCNRNLVFLIFCSCFLLQQVIAR